MFWIIGIIIVVIIATILAWRIYGGRAERGIKQGIDKGKATLKDTVDKVL